VPHPEVTILSDYLSAASDNELRQLDLTEFLSFENIDRIATKEANLRRRSLRLILCAENLLRLSVNNKLNDGQEDEAVVLVEEMQEVGNNLRSALREVSGDNKTEKANNLLYVANNLLSTRLRLIRIIPKQKISEKKSVPREQPDDLSCELKTPDESEQKLPNRVENTDKKTERVSKNKPEPKMNRWLVMATILAVVLGFAFYISASVNESPAVVTQDAKTIDTKNIPGGENMVVAKVNNGSLICVVNETWKSLSEDTKKEQLQLIVGNSKEYQFKSVLLLNSQGEIVARGSEKEISVK
jgi:hypothetical protein